MVYTMSTPFLMGVSMYVCGLCLHYFFAVSQIFHDAMDGWVGDWVHQGEASKQFHQAVAG